MSWPEPHPGLVIRYSYLWRREARLGREEGVKDRPCAVVLAVRREEETQVFVLPITHAMPANSGEAIEIPSAVKRHLGLDTDRSWIVATEANAFAWPGPDLRSIPGRGPETVAFGTLPPAFFRKVRDRFVELLEARRAGFTRRSE